MRPVSIQGSASILAFILVKTAQSTRPTMKVELYADDLVEDGDLHQNWLDFFFGSNDFMRDASMMDAANLHNQTWIMFRKKVMTEGIPLELLTSINAVEEESLDDQPTSLGRSAMVGCTDPDRCRIPLTLKGIWGYGCWCNFGNKLGQGHGPAVSAEDTICQRFQKCLRCSSFDAHKSGMQCDAKTTGYHVSRNSLGGLSGDALNLSCYESNQNSDCAASVCTCELQLIADLLDRMWNLQPHEPQFRRPDNPFGGTFDRQDNCGVQPSQGTSGDIDCCGEFPFRFPYKTHRAQCCSNEVKAIGSC